MRILRTVFGLMLLVGLAAGFILPRARPAAVLGSYITSLQGRTRGQRANATLAARALDGVVIMPGATFSFNKVVGPWTPDRGYVRALVSYEGELVTDWGGGVCQTSTTLYNAALIAGLTIVQRQPHTWMPHYIPPGQDAAVAQYDIDLRLHNPYHWPVRVQAGARHDRLYVRFSGEDQGPMAEVRDEVLGAERPVELVRAEDQLPGHQLRLVNRGRPGARVVVYRTFLRGPRAGRRELVSEDSYPVMNRIIAAP